MSEVYYKFYNPHPRGLLVGDCVKRAVCAATGWSYKSTSNVLNAIKRRLDATSYSSQCVGFQLAYQMGWKCVWGEKREEIPRMHVAEFCKTHPKGIYILHIGKPRHWVTCIDGVLWDTWDSSDKYLSWYFVVKEGT